MGVNVARQAWMSDEVYEWACMEEQARLNSLERCQYGNRKVLIAIKSQHPLHANGMVGDEFAERLSEAIKLRYRLIRQGFGVQFMTFGGIHAGCDNVTLAEAGETFLCRCGGISPKQITMFPEVFSGNDEDRLAVEAFEKGDFAELHIVMGAGQWERTRLYCIALGWQPFLHPVVHLRSKPGHSTVCELWGDWGVPAFAKGMDEVNKMTERIVQKHLEEAK